MHVLLTLSIRSRRAVTTGHRQTLDTDDVNAVMCGATATMLYVICVGGLRGVWYGGNTTNLIASEM